MELAEEVYKLVRLLPKEELYSLSAQLKRSCVSIPSNIAEGYSRYTTKDYVRFLYIARGSLSETQTQLLLSIKLNFITDEQASKSLSLSNEIGKILNAIISKLTPKS
jgi:four helix bundle protein